MFHSYYDMAVEELRHLESISRLDRNELRSRKRSVLLKYTRNEALVDALVSHDLFLTEYAFLERAKSEDWLRSSIDELLSIFRSAGGKHREQFIQLLVAYRDDVSRAADNCAQMDMITPPEVPGLEKAVVKLAFRDIGDFLEGSFQVFAKFVLACLYITGDKDPERVRQMSFGQCVSEILEAGKLGHLYRPAPWNIQLSQWRNIANHNSYGFDLADEKITCEYGTKTKTTIHMAPEDLYALRLNLGKAYNAHKITHAIVFLEHAKDVVALGGMFTVRPETIVHQIKEFTFSHGFSPKQSEPNRPLTTMQFGSDANGDTKYPVVNCGAVADIDERANSLARTIATYMKAETFLVEVYDESNALRSLHTASYAK
jgi:hypothetical protein